MRVCYNFTDEEMEALIDRADAEFDLDTIFVSDFDKKTNRDYLLAQSWFITFEDNNGKLLALLMLEWVDHRVASLHFVLFNRGNILKGWKIFLNMFSQHFDELQTYIPVDRLDVLKISKALGFNHNKDERYYYGRRLT